MLQGLAECRDRQRKVERHFRERGANPHTGDKRRTDAPDNSKSRHRHISSEGICDQVDGVAEFQQGPNAVILAEGRPARFEERLGRDHQDVHAAPAIVLIEGILGQ
jgi:hypothetical protein